ncbi:NAD(P)/FAD-dependent oxidoreductase [Glaciibacter psychrotolerans]|uniref:Thioredoxin reductase (NADPH) n=1 Tax=Glaciibacter psychrotolerans TaxID=670054 RepID=A0A7Z0EF58_9MICO|nr:NAD(P)/FAD-dependent oxidoreductase [Leifsonia psychrotolerans]NYJ20110.1 thioredoxin reductase (NADPH) [Leifsonia psychrotolerans]
MTQCKDNTIEQTAPPQGLATGTGQSPLHDVVVIGGGAAGLAAATSLARFRHRVAVIDAGEPRNSPAKGIHNYLSRDGMPPAELLRIGREELNRYGADVIEGTVTAVRKALAGPALRFTVELADGRALSARRVLIASGLTDELPDVPDIAQRWGRDVLHCPYCHGWEVRDHNLAVFVTAAPGLHTVQLWRQLSNRVTAVLAPGVTPSDEQWEQFAARGISVVEGTVSELVLTGNALSGLLLASGHVVECDALAISTSVHARVDFLAPLGLRPAPFTIGETVVGSRLETGPMGATEVPGLYAAGNATDLFAQVAGSVSGGLLTASAVNVSLIEEDTAAAVLAVTDHTVPAGITDPHPITSDSARNNDDVEWTGYGREH